MARTIWKFPVEIADRFELHMSADASILSAQVQDDAPYLWADVDPKAKTIRRVFRVFGTGNPLPAGMGVDLRYIGTFQMPPFVWHLYEHV